MTTLYRPVLIESAEQAEALPVGTIAIVGEPPVESSVKWDDRLWYSGRDFDDGAPSRRMAGALALVPIEAEEEWTVGHDAPAWAPGTETWAREFQAHEPGRRLFRRSTTAWEEA